ncbi:MAG: 4-diphosphocytidyl-2C-methyl-D-erythritol synthase [Frankiales bacterium]|nr:4-diphosphocytidyl-2C-methyl-D-erythritol synthase [Frankiales bacterium]
MSVPQPPAPVAGLVLAAGAGRRLGQPKADLLFRGRRLIEAATELLFAGGCLEVVAVLRAGQSPPEGVTAVINADPDRGMGSSLALGLASVQAEACVIVLVDQVGIQPAEIAAAIERYRAGAQIVVARRAARRSHPVLVSRRWYADFSAAAVGDQGGRAFIDGHSDRVQFLDLPDEIADIDTPADLDALG